MQNSKRDNKPTNLTVNSVKYEMRDDPFEVPIKFKREVPLNKNIFELKEPLPKNYGQGMQNQEAQQAQMHDPIAMDSASLKLLLIEKLNGYVSVFSILLSIFQLYWVPLDDIDTHEYVNIVSTGMTALLLVQMCTRTYFHYVNQKARHYQRKFLIIYDLPKILMVLLAPSVWTKSINKYLHLTLLLRVYFPLTYSIRASMYYNPRSARITNLYGMKPQLTFNFAMKVILNQKSISDVIMVYFVIVMFYSHCLFAISQQIAFIDCFEVVIATLPTIGYGQTNIVGMPRIVILCIVVTGVPLNAFVTFVMLKHFEMTTSERNSYILQEKLRMRDQIEQISSKFILDKIQHRKRRLLKKKNDIEVDQNFRERFNEYKARYRNLNPHDSIYQFNYFKQMLNEVKIKTLQTNNMINVLLDRLAASQKQQKKIVKNLDHPLDD